MTKRLQLNSNISQVTQAQITWLTRTRGYSVRDVITVAVDRLYREEGGGEEGSMKIKFEDAISPAVMARGWSRDEQIARWAYMAIEDRKSPGSCAECQKPDFPGVNKSARIVSRERTGSSTWVEVEISAQTYEALGAWLDGQA